MSIRYGHGNSTYARRHSCPCTPCTVAALRWDARHDGIIDDVAVQRRMNGDATVWVTHQEMVEAAGRLNARGYGWPQIGHILHQNGRTASRLLAEYAATTRPTPTQPMTLHEFITHSSPTPMHTAA